MNKILFPSNNAELDFAAAGGNIGWVPTQDTSLKKMAESFIPTKDKVVDHAIPSPIAHIKDFHSKLNSTLNLDDEKNKSEAEIIRSAINEWRGMLAVIALQKLKSINITVRQIPIYHDSSTGTPSMLGRIICDALTENPQITGYGFETQTVNSNGEIKTQLITDNNGKPIPEYKTLSVFCKDDVPFAMFMPGMVICPFKEYPKNLFAGLEWYDELNGKWKDVCSVICPDSNVFSVTAQKLYWWIDSILHGHTDNNLLKFQKDIRGECPAPESNPDNNPIPVNYDDVKIWNSLKTVCPPPKGAPVKAYADKLFIIIPPDDHFQSVTEDGKNYAIQKKGFSPKVNQLNNKPYYVVSPIHRDVVDCLRKGCAEFISWSVVPSQDNEYYTFDFSLNFADSGEIMTYQKVYKNIDVVYTDSMPYLSMWPFVNFVDDDWKEHLVSIWSEPKERRLVEYADITEKTQKLLGYSKDGITTPTVKISLIALKDDATINVCECASTYKDKKFTMLQSDSQPFALEFNYELAGKSHCIGCWIIDRSLAETVDPATARKNFYIAMDFGTTSTNVCLRENIAGAVKMPESISSAGKYLSDIYNPYITKNNCNKQKDSDFFQNYYLFSSRSGSLGKIFTYGQNFNVKKNGIVYGEYESNVSGRAVVVDEGFIVDGDNEGSRIYTGLKLKNQTQQQELILATRNFILNILTYAVLEAKAKGATTINLRISYPDVKLHGVVLSHLGDVQKSLALKSSANIIVECATEACAAGEYFSTFVMDPLRKPVPTEGYGVVDIGGGTTDFSFWRADLKPGSKAEMKAEHSFGYAGRYLVVKTFIQAVKSATQFSNMWQAPKGPVADAIAKYNDITIQQNISNSVVELSPDYAKKAAALDFILEKVPVNTSMLSRSEYDTLFSTMRIKYYALFYLVAKYIRAKIESGEIVPADTGMRICLAGCGSKGIGLCSVGEIGMNFKIYLEMMMKRIIGFADDYALVITTSDSDRKEEVVFGLTTTANVTPLNSMPVGPIFDEESTSNTEFVPVEYDMQAFVDAYSELVNILSKFERVQEGGNHLLNNINIQTNPAAFAYFKGIIAYIKNDLVRANCDPATYLEHFALLMLDAMIDNFI